MKRLTLFIFSFLLLCSVSGQTGVICPPFNDKYSQYVKKLESGDTNIDYQDFRFKYIESEQFKIASEKSSELSNMTLELYKQMEKLQFEEIIATAKKMLSIDYTNMTAHKILAQTYDMIEDVENAAKYEAIQTGLLQSIIQNGNGKSCPTAWTIIQLSEEYFILQMLGGKVQNQTTDHNGRFCDKIEVKSEDEDETKTYYFNLDKVFEGKDNLMK